MIVSAVALLLHTQCIRAQGCSDAGFCTVGAMLGATPVADSGRYRSSIAFSCTIGSGEQSTAIVIPQLEWRQSAGPKGFVELKLPYYTAAGNLGGHSGLGDPLITYTCNLLKKTDRALLVTAGLRISTGEADAKTGDGRPLPMPYQSTLGTTDVILGLSLNYTRFFTAAFGYQQPVIQYNHNGYAPAGPDPMSPHYSDYFLSARLRRRGDVLLRAEGHYLWRRIGISAGPLFIYHIGRDRAEIAGVETLLDGSEGLTLNLAGNIVWTAQRWKADVSAGTPLVVRSYRPDGLTREWVVTPRISYLFR